MTRKNEPRSHARGWIVLAGSVLVAIGVGAIVITANGFGFGESKESGTLNPATERITKETLTVMAQRSGKVKFANSLDVKTESGIVTWLPAFGSKIERGGQVVRVNDKPVLLMYGTLPLYRPLNVGSKGNDVEEVEQNLTDLGFKGLKIDSEYTQATADAVKRWQKSLGVEETGSIGPDWIVIADGPQSVTKLAAPVGSPAATTFLTLSGQQRVVTVDLTPADQEYAVAGATVSIKVGTAAAGTGKVTSFETTSSNGRDVTTVTVTPDDSTIFGDSGATSAQVTFSGEKRDNVLTVPISALVALAEGGYGIEVVTSKDTKPTTTPNATSAPGGSTTGDTTGKDPVTTKYVAVTTGLFASGRVEISGDGIVEGLRVVVPR